jgi:predicted esterase
MQEHHFTVPCSVRYFTLGSPGPETTDVWFVCHGYGQLARQFLADFEPLASPSRCIVAPEGRSLFYTNHRRREVGASWMTREDRLAAIGDYVRLLDQVYERVFARLHRSRVTVHVLGFSKGGATATRWVTLGRVVADRLILWGELLPPDLDLDVAWGKLEDARLTFVLGRTDSYVDESRFKHMENLLLDHDIPYESIRYDGGHWIDQEVLLSLAPR